MEQRRFFTFFLISMAVWMTWINFVVPRFFPELNKPVAKPIVKVDGELEDRNVDADGGATSDKSPEANLQRDPDAAPLNVAARAAASGVVSGMNSHATVARDDFPKSLSI